MTSRRVIGYIVHRCPVSTHLIACVVVRVGVLGRRADTEYGRPGTSRMSGVIRRMATNGVAPPQLMFPFAM